MPKVYMNEFFLSLGGLARKECVVLTNAPLTPFPEKLVCARTHSPGMPRKAYTVKVIRTSISIVP